MGLSDLTIITHTHTDCSDLWSPYFDSYKNFLSSINHIVLINEKTNKISLEQIVYDDKLLFSDRLLHALSLIKTEFVLISLEDMFLYDRVNENRLSDIINIMKANDDIFYTRLIKSGIKSLVPYTDTLFYIRNEDFSFSITPTIWNVDKLISTLRLLIGLTIWQLEINGDSLLKDRDFIGLYHYNNEPKRGGHYDSDIYPHICSAICKGKWNIKEYGTEIRNIIEKYNISINDRGVF